MSSERQPPDEEARGAIWAVQILLALVFSYVGFLHTSFPLVELTPRMPWVEALPSWAVRGIGALELVGAVGLVAPASMGARPWITPVAAYTFAAMMLGASALHVVLRDGASMLLTGALGSMAVAVGFWGRRR